VLEARGPQIIQPRALPRIQNSDNFHAFLYPG